MATAAAPRSGTLAVVGYFGLKARTFWRTVLIISIITPLLYGLALGVGLGTVVNRSGQLAVPYVAFVTPAFVCAAALQIGASDASWPLLSGFKWHRVFHGLAGTPLHPAQIADGALLWIGMRLLASSTIYLAIMTVFGGTRSSWAVLTVPVAALTGLAFAAPVAALTASVESDGTPFNVLFRFVVTPMFLFSGTFYPIDQLPRWGQWLAWVSPLWHGTDLARGIALGDLSAGRAIVHLVYLGLWLGVGVALARWRFRVRLTR